MYLSSKKKVDSQWNMTSGLILMVTTLEVCYCKIVMVYILLEIWPYKRLVVLKDMWDAKRTRLRG